MGNMKKEKIFVTGGTGGLGRELVHVFLNNGHEVHFSYCHQQRMAEELLQENKNSALLHAYQLDQGSISSIKQLFSQLPKDINILINNSALGSQSVEEVSDDRYQADLEMMKVNALGPLWITEEFLKHNASTQEKIILNISSVGGGIFHFPGFRHSDGMSKAALAFLTKQLASEHLHDHTTIFALCPGALDTQMFRKSTLNKMSEQEREKFIKNLPHAKLISPREMAENIYQLVTTHPKHFHGAVIDASQGLGVSPFLSR